FGSMIGADTLPVRKPDPRPFFAAVDGVAGNRAQSLLVGDTNTDRETSRNAGVPSVLVAFGPAGDTVATLKPEAVIEHFDELLGVSRRLLAD
ncbi:MAG: HAD hydrolase-like protein, partial [Pseudomonadota bacterium]|nr:HAD hydrolase-like protein [Pseudomonadota bacterium]